MMFRILGPLEIETSAGISITPWALKQRALLAYLCANNASFVSSRRLLDSLWADTPPRSASTALYVYVSKLRKHLKELHIDPAILVTVPSGYQLDLPEEYLDLHLFESRFSQACDLQARGWAEQASDVLNSAIGLWRGQAVEDLRHLPAFDSIGRRLDERRMLAIERRFELEISLGRHNVLIGELQSLTEEQPTWETIYGYLMISLYRSGRTAESLSVFSRIRRVLVDELGIEPGPRLQEIQRAVLTRDAWLDDIHSPISSSVAFAA
ncbi:AfsR/SARP family transcriptional regulator [Streptomyces sp. NBC_01275]|uniref:AfsR/SARP family transcriptional regulator n=1 Tax=Streptomyces sp. NBC_01275 TaxID=2903807 RepID=UPI00224D7623|nr:AfsR/SARP family transcriptional regulator [Streptomyces sp. NBC_01275]MCX4763947.1 AfsR/SARP family transcriptional regulator [Streptomyces sp. NBC_01275]